MTILEQTITLKSALKTSQLEEIETLVDAIYATIPHFEGAVSSHNAPVKAEIEPEAMFKFSYGLFVLTAHAEGKDNGCIINTAAQLTDNPKRINIAVNKQNFTHDMILKTGIFNLSFLSEKVSFDTFKQFGFQSGKEVDKFADYDKIARSANGLLYLTEGTNCYMSAKVIDALDYGSHTLFIAEVTEAKVISPDPSVTYAYYFDHIKPKPQPKIEEEKTGWVCKICG